MEELLKEKADLEAKIAAKIKDAEQAQNDIYWLKKRVKLVDSQIAEKTEKPAKDGE
jgi:hypothetical protein